MGEFPSVMIVGIEETDGLGANVGRVPAAVGRYVGCVGRGVGMLDGCVGWSVGTLV